MQLKKGLNLSALYLFYFLKMKASSRVLVSAFIPNMQYTALVCYTGSLVDISFENATQEYIPECGYCYTTFTLIEPTSGNCYTEIKVSLQLHTYCNWWCERSHGHAGHEN